MSSFLVGKFQGERYGNPHNSVAPTECLDYYKFCSVRHPYTRAISMYFYIERSEKHRCHKLLKGKTFQQYLIWLTNLKELPRPWMNKYDFRPHWCKSLSEGETYRQSINMRYGRDLNQVDFLSFVYGNNYMDRMSRILRVETLKDDFQRLPFVGKQVELPVGNVNPKKVSWRSMMNKTNEELIYKWAKEDFIAFNYGRETF